MPDTSRGRRVAGLVLASMTVLVLVLGLLDPAFAPFAMILGGALILATWLVSRVAVPALEIVAWGAALAFGFMTVVAWVFWMFSADSHPTEDPPWWTWVLFGAFELAVAVTVGGAVWHLGRQARTARRSKGTY